MKTLSYQAVAYRKTAVFRQDTIPMALRQRHTTKEGSWGKIWVISGQLRYQILSDIPETHTLTPDLPGIIEPQIPHQVESVGPVEFYVEFYRETEH